MMPSSDTRSVPPASGEDSHSDAKLLKELIEQEKQVRLIKISSFATFIFFLVLFIVLGSFTLRSFNAKKLSAAFGEYVASLWLDDDTRQEEIIPLIETVTSGTEQNLIVKLDKGWPALEKKLMKKYDEFTAAAQPAIEEQLLSGFRSIGEDDKDEQLAELKRHLPGLENPEINRVFWSAVRNAAKEAAASRFASRLEVGRNAVAQLPKQLLDFAQDPDEETAPPPWERLAEIGHRFVDGYVSIQKKEQTNVR